MIKTIQIVVILAFFLLALVKINAQNLIQNYSFENITSCPITASNSVYLAVGWDVYLPSPDFFHSCGGPGATTPQNWFGYQQPSDGDAYCGFYVHHTTTGPNYREYIGYQLSTPLDIGSCYNLSFKMNFTDSSNYTIDKVGALLSINNYGRIYNFAHVYADTLITDKATWYTVSGRFMAETPYTHIILGNFFDDANTDTLYVGGGNPLNFSYFLVDEIVLEKDTVNPSCPCNSPIANFDVISSGNYVQIGNNTPLSNSFQWDFGDGHTDTIQHPSHNYDSIGTYNICLITGNICGFDTLCDSVIITCTTPSACFNSSSSALTASFSDCSSITVTDWFWDFGDGNTDSIEFPVHTYLNPGTYTVCLTVTSCVGYSNTYCNSINVTCVSPEIGFINTDSLLTVNFSDTTYSTTYWLWDFGDGNIDTIQNPVHTYDSAGAYYICLIAGNQCGDDTICDTIVLSCPTPLADFVHTDSLLTINFIDSSTDATSWYWEFGDGNTDSIQNPTHVYDSAGTYNVCLTAFNACGVDTTCQLLVVSCQLPVVNLSASICEGDSVFVAGSWVLVAGTYYDSLASANGCDSVIITTLTVNQLPTVNLGADTTICNGCSITLDAGAGFTGYIWSTGENTQTIIVDSAGTYYVQVTDVNGCVDRDTIAIDITSGIAVTNMQDVVKIYPTPNSGQFTLLMLPEVVKTEISVYLYNVLGEVIYKKEVFSKPYLTIDISDHPKGIYFIKLLKGNDMFVAKIIYQ